MGQDLTTSAVVFNASKPHQPFRGIVEVSHFPSLPSIAHPLFGVRITSTILPLSPFLHLCSLWQFIAPPNGSNPLQKLKACSVDLEICFPVVVFMKVLKNTEELLLS